MGGTRSAALPWCPALAGAGPPFPSRSAPLGGALLGRLLHRLLLGLRLRLHLHCCLSHGLLSLSLSRVRISSNIGTLRNFFPFVDSKYACEYDFIELLSCGVAASPQFLLISQRFAFSDYIFASFFSSRAFSRIQTPASDFRGGIATKNTSAGPRGTREPGRMPQLSAYALAGYAALRMPRALRAGLRRALPERLVVVFVARLA